MISIQNISKSYGDLQVLKGVDLEIKEKEVISIVGASGAGKTTLLQILGTLDIPDNGEVLFDSQNISSLKGKKLAQFRNQNIGFVFQFHHLLPEFTAFENVCIPGYLSNTPKKEIEERAVALLTQLGLGERLDHKPSALSGGEQQRVAVARALINKPKVILADEPSGNLDSKNAAELHQLFFTLRDTMNQTFVIVTHNETLANMSDRKVVMKDGVII